MRPVVLAAPLLVLLAGCGGQTSAHTASDSGAASPSEAGGADDAPSDVNSASCPPFFDTSLCWKPCSQTGLTCQYDGDALMCQETGNDALVWMCGV
jgi:hypothetical protein